MPGHQLVLSRDHLGPGTVSAYGRALRRWRPAILDGYTSNLVTLAELLQGSGFTVRIPLVVTTCEVLTDAGRQLLREVFGGAVCDKYGTSENAVLATECPAGSRHIFQNVGIVEAVDRAGRAVPDGQPGRLLLTSLTNDLMPLVRYEVGDVGAIVRSPACACGRYSPDPQQSLGREDDTIVLGDGRQIRSSPSNFSVAWMTCLRCRSSSLRRRCSSFEEGCDELILRRGPPSSEPSSADSTG